QIAVHILGRVKLLPLTGADPQHAVAIEPETMAEMAVAGYLRRLPADHLQVLECAPTIFIQHYTGPRHRSAGATIASLGITDVDLLVVCELRMQHHIAQPTLAGMDHLRYAADGFRTICCQVVQAQRTRHLGDQQPAIRQEGHGPGSIELSYFGHAEG